MKASRTTSFLACTTLVLVYLVIIAGSVVRTTGSGMGCPDWPKCCGQWIPPTDESELPEGYEAHFLEGRKAKLDKYTSLIEALGMKKTAEAMRQDLSLLHSEPFDAQGTWIEYVNRLFGFLAGNTMLALAIASLWMWKGNKRIALLSGTALIAIVFQAWLGSVVVATNLLPWTITIHMVVAFFILALLLKIISYVKKGKSSELHMKSLLGFAIFLTLIQVVLGTQVRQEIDHLADALIQRSEWIAGLSNIFEIHRSFSILILFVNGFFLWKNKHAWKENGMKTIAMFLVLEVLVGIILAYLGMPAVAQTLHLVLATLLFGVQCAVLFGAKGIPKLK
jgi:cytochrome c oxidase assembly protein subunit 15